MNKQTVKTVGVVLAIIAATAFVQRNVFALPVVGEYLPK